MKRLISWFKRLFKSKLELLEEDFRLQYAGIATAELDSISMSTARSILQSILSAVYVARFDGRFLTIQSAADRHAISIIFILEKDSGIYYYFGCNYDVDIDKMNYDCKEQGMQSTKDGKQNFYVSGDLLMNVEGKLLKAVLRFSYTNDMYNFNSNEHVEITSCAW